MKYKIIDVKERVERNKVFCMMVIEVDTDEIASTGFQIVFEIQHGMTVTKEFIEQKIKGKIEHIKRVKRRRNEKKPDIQQIKKIFLNSEGEF